MEDLERQFEAMLARLTALEADLARTQAGWLSGDSDRRVGSADERHRSRFAERTLSRVQPVAGRDGRIY